MGAGAARGPGRAAGAGRRVRRARRADLAGRRPQPAAHPAARRPRRRGHRRPARSPTSRRSSAPTPQRRARRGPDHRGRRVLPDAAGLVRRSPWPTGERTELLRKEAPGFDPAAYVGEQRSFPSVDGTPVPATILRHRRHAAGRHRALRDVRLRRLRVGLPRPGVGPGDPLAARPRRRLRARARPRRRRGRPALVAGRPDGAQAAHLRRPPRRRRRARRGRPRRRLADRHPRPLRRRAAPGRGLLPAARPLARGGRRGAVRRRAHHDARPDHPADGQRVGRVGRPVAGPRTTRGWPPTRRTTTSRRPAAAPTCSSPAPSTTRGSWSGSRPSGSPPSARPTPTGPRAASSASRPAPAPTSAPPGRFAHLAYEAEVYAWLLDRLGVG